METLWTPWRMEYILSDRTTDSCVFCDAVKEKKTSRENLILHSGKYSAVIMNRFPYTNGHLMIIPMRHTKDFESLSSEENGEMMLFLQASHSIILEAMQAHGFNMGCNLGESAGAGITEHLHWHIIPRWKGDVNFMTLVSEVRMIPQHILETFDLLSPLFKKKLGGEKKT